NTNQCLQIASACQGQQVSINITATTKVGDTACDEPVPFDMDNQFCVSGDVSVVPNFVDTQLDALPGDLVPGGAFVDVKPPLPDAGGSYCISVFETIDGTSTRIGSTCEPGGIQYNARPGLFCGYAVAHDENNNISATVQFPCLLSPAQPKPPSPPQILTFNVDNSLARFTFRLPAEQTAIAISRLSHNTVSGGETSSSTNIPVIDNEGGESISASMMVAPLQTNRDTLCLQIMSVGRDDGTGSAAHSDWSSEKCFTRTAAGEDVPDYLPWPAVHGATEGAPLEARAVTNYLQFSPFLAISLGETAVFSGSPDLGSSYCWITLPDFPNDVVQDFFPFTCFDNGHMRFITNLEPELRFLMYRQSRISGGAASDWVQVSPLIDYVHFDREVVDIGLDEGPITVWTLNDPYIKTFWDLVSSGTVEVLFVDQYPFQMGGSAFPGGVAAPAHEWRYQAVYFDAQHRPVQYRVSDWFGGEAP
ncbi:MAG: hypothetical protein OEM25_03440, partial [Gammaproteobacteria bacterium]|nr:hypothetical protein [Gammaproteobacteria bacterium]